MMNSPSVDLNGSSAQLAFFRSGPMGFGISHHLCFYVFCTRRAVLNVKNHMLDQTRGLSSPVVCFHITAYQMSQVFKWVMKAIVFSHCCSPVTGIL